MGCATKEMAPASVPLKMDLVAEDKPAAASLGLRVEKRALNTSDA